MVRAQDRPPEETITSKSSTLEIQTNSFSRSGTHVWNILPPKLRHVHKSRLKKELCVSLLNILESENEYIGVAELITRLPKVKLMFYIPYHNCS